MDLEHFFNLKTYAVIGASRNPEKYGYKVMKHLMAKGKTVFPVNPGASEIDGLQCYPSLLDIPEPVEGVSIIVPPKQTEALVDMIIDLHIKHVWMQPGAESPDAILKCEAAGINVIHHQCVLLTPLSEPDKG